MSNKLLRLKEVQDRVGLRHTHIYKLMNEGRFPLPVKQSTRNVRWFSDEIDAWIEARRAERDAEAA